MYIVHFSFNRRDSIVRGAYFRKNFEDIFSYRGAQKLEWFEVLEGNDCSPIPATVNAGRPPRDICVDAGVDERYGNIGFGVSSSEIQTIYIGRFLDDNERVSWKSLYLLIYNNDKTCKIRKFGLSTANFAVKIN